MALRFGDLGGSLKQKGGWFSTLLVNRPEITGVGKDVEQRNPCSLLVGTEVGEATTENSMKVPQKSKNRTTL